MREGEVHGQGHAALPTRRLGFRHGSSMPLASRQAAMVPKNSPG
jgi:hypothetical protein